ncbi:hypothetical protein AB835_00175 [Candidatus Endobugula sertula]|uniref:Cation transporter n=1 Tax=Candidatus Endobugula sertula TaxID=62101 RepID=A0A1D2QU62_9GAMM|nr:hypothetical protein AB835_00175 [Candidatus Endobugula sertula]
MIFNRLYRLLIALVLLWILLSGMFEPMLLILGFISVLLVCFFAYQMRVLVHRGQSIYFRPLHIIRYWCWLVVEIFKSNWGVTKRVFNPLLPIKPVLKAIPAKQKTELGRVIYANSITLTPGTVAINIAKSGEILVHALHEDSIRELEMGHMDEKVCELEPSLPRILDSELTRNKE